MAELPPKIPITASSISDHRPWAEEFFNFSMAKRNAHRPLSESIAFFKTPPMVEKCDSSSVTLRSRSNEFDGLDDEQLMTMFSDEIISASTSVVVPQTMSSSNPSTSSDRNSINDEKPTQFDQQQHLRNNDQTGEVESPCKPDPQALPPPTSSSGDPIRDPKRVKRILANRQSAQRSRVRKLQYISELERSVTSLQTEVSALSPRVAYLDHQRLVLNVDNSALKQRIAALAQDKIFKDAHQEALKKEIERLRQVYHQQNLKKMGSTANVDAQHCKDKEETNMEKEEEERVH